MSPLAPILQGFFTDKLIRQRQASPHTIAAYRDTFRLLLAFAWRATGIQPTQLDLSNLDAPLITAFLQHLEIERANTVNDQLRVLGVRGRLTALDQPHKPVKRTTRRRHDAQTCRGDPSNAAPWGGSSWGAIAPRRF